MGNEQNSGSGLQGNMGVLALVMGALAFVAPLGGISGALPAFMSLGGSGTASIFIMITIGLIIFSFGFAKMGLLLPRPGGFYAYVSESLGKKMGMVNGGLASIGYLFICQWAPALFAIELNNLLGNTLGFTAPWIVWAVATCLLCTFFAYHRIDLSAKIMVFVMIFEAIIVIIFDILCFVNGVPETGSDMMFTMPLANGKFGSAALMVLGAYFGFEAIVIYREETKNPEKTTTQAIFITVIFLGVFWTFSAWAYNAYYGAPNMEQVATDIQGTIFNDTMLAMTNKTVMSICNFFAIFSVFASQLSIQNVANRYWYSLGVDGALPKKFGEAHHKHHSPWLAALVVGGIATALQLVFYVARPDDPEGVYPMFSGCGTFFVTINLFLVSVAMLAFFMKNREKFKGQVSVWTGTICPILSVIWIGIVTILAVKDFDALLGTNGVSTAAFVALVVVVILASYIYAWWLEKNKPDVYARLGRQNPDVVGE